MIYIIAIGIFCLSVGNIVFPRQSWYWQRGWQFKDVEPSDAALSMQVVGGIAGICCAIGLLVLAIHH